MKKQKKKKIILAICIFLLITAAVSSVFITKHHRFTQTKNLFLSQNLELYDDFSVISPSAEVDKSRCSATSFKEAVRLGANTVVLDTCFDKDNIPVISESYDKINDESLKFEDIAKLLTQKEYQNIKVCLKIKQLGSLSVLNSILSEYSISDRVIICGIDEERYGLVSGNDTFAKVYFDYKPADIASRSIEEIGKLKAKYNISGVIISYKDITEELLKLLSENSIQYIISGIEEELDMYKALSMGIPVIETDKPKLLNEIYENWRNETQKRIDASVIDELQK